MTLFYDPLRFRRCFGDSFGLCAPVERRVQTHTKGLKKKIRVVRIMFVLKLGTGKLASGSGRVHVWVDVCETCTTKKLAVSPNTTLHTKHTSSVNQHSLVVLQRSRASTLPSYHPRPIPTQHTTDERNKAAPWRPPGSPGSAGVVATSVAAAAAASAAMARPAINVRRKRTSGSPPPRKISTGGRQTGRRSGPSPEEEFFRGEGDGDGDEGGPGYGYGYGYGEEEESPRSAGGAYEEWLAGERYAGCFVFGRHWAWIVTAVTGSSPCHISCTCNE